MQKIKIIIADKDEVYCDCISRYLIERNNIINLTYITKYDFIKDGIIKYEPDMVIISPDFLSDDIKNVLKNTLTLILDNNNGECCDDFDKISKFQKTENFINEIILKYAENTNNKNFFVKKNDNTKLIMMYSPMGYCGKSTISYSLARYIAEKGKNVLYFNMEKIGLEKNFINYKDEGITMSDLFLVYKEENIAISDNNDRLFFQIKKSILKDDESGIYYILPPKSGLEFEEMQIEEIMNFFNKIQDTGMFDYILIDMDIEFTTKNLNIMQGAWKVFTIFEPSYRGYIKYNQFLKEMRMRIEHNIVMKKMIPIINCLSDNLYLENMMGSFENKEIIIPYINKIKGYYEFKNSYVIFNS